MRDTLKRLTAEQFKSAVRSGEFNSNSLVTKQTAGLEIKEVDGQERVLEMVISSGAVDRDGDTISPSGWETTNYLKNPVVLWAHDSGAPPVAKSLTVYTEGDKVKSKAQFMTRDLSNFADMIYRMLREGFLNASSVGFLPLKWVENGERGGFMPMDFEKQELLEWSVTPVPSNPEALLGAKSKGINTRPLVEWAEKILDTDEAPSLLVPREYVEQIRKTAGDEPTVSQVPSDCAAGGDSGDGQSVVLAKEPGPAAQVEPKSQELTRQLEPDESERAIKAAQEAFDAAVDCVSGLAQKLCGAIDGLSGLTKRGRVLSAVNESKLREARDLLDQVVAQVVSDDDSDKSQKHVCDEDYLFEIQDDDHADGVEIDVDELKAAFSELLGDTIDQRLRRARGRVD